MSDRFFKKKKENLHDNHLGLEENPGFIIQCVYKPNKIPNNWNLKLNTKAFRLVTAAVAIATL